jgi:hypothetical protein
LKLYLEDYGKYYVIIHRSVNNFCILMQEPQRGPHDLPGRQRPKRSRPITGDNKGKHKTDIFWALAMLVLLKSLASGKMK